MAPIRTYISLFSSAGVGCYGFKMNGFECIATNELLGQRLDIQKANHKCKYDSGYICGDAASEETHRRIFAEIEKWKNKENLRQVDVVFATPPCQGMSTANYKKTDHEQIRNSLVIQAIRIIKEIHPKVFVFENVRAFMKSICTDISGKDMSIRESIYKNLSDNYNIYWKVINFKDYGIPSSRPRTLVIGTSRDLDRLSPLHLFPTRMKEIPLKDSIGSYRHLAYCEKDPLDPLHFARPFPEYMLPWIKDLKEGETAFDNPDETKPYSINKEGKRVINKGAYMGNKYRRLFWDKPGACIATRSDVMSSQDTIHPSDNRVLSIRELMTLMTIPKSFVWTDHDDTLSVENSDEYLRENEGNIRRCIGEAVPTKIIYEISRKVNEMLSYQEMLTSGAGYNNDGFYAHAHDYGIDILPQKAFNQIITLKEDCSKITIKVSSMNDFVLFAPMLAAFYSDIELITIGIGGVKDEEIEKIARLNEHITWGTNILFKILPINEKVADFDIVINSGQIISFPSRKKQSSDAAQLSLF